MINWKLKTRSQQPIGLDIGHSSIKMIQLAVNGGQTTVLAADKVRIDPRVNGDTQQRRSFVVAAVKQMLAQSNFKGREVVSCLPNDELKLTSLRLAEATSGEIPQVLRKEAAQRFGLNPETDAIDYMLAGDVRQGDEIKNELILFAADNESVKSHIGLLEEAGLRPVGIDALPCALFRSFERSLQRQEDNERTAVFVDVGSRFTTVVFSRGREVNFVKQLSIGGDTLNQEIAAKLGVKPDEAEMLRHKLRLERSQDAERDFSPGHSLIRGDTPQHTERDNSQDTLDASTRQVMIDAISAVAERLAREISLCFRYYTVTFRGKRVERAVFSGGEAYETILLNVLRRQLAVEIEVAQPLRGFDMMDLSFDSDRRGLL
ncbi:MAG: pilus assembly protein PilM, partial [Planctomycetota bacterium]